MKKIIILGGGENQIPLIQRAKALGLYIVLCDFRDNQPGIALSDIHYKINAMNSDEIIAVGQKEHVDGIVTNSEPLFVAMAKAAEALGLRCLSPKDTELYKNKHVMREFCVEHNLLSPAFRYCTNLSEAEDFFVKLGKKCIIKPLDNSASRGVFSINNIEELREHFDESISSSSVANPAVLIEEYVTGTEFTIDSLKTTNGNKCLAISEKKHYSHNENVAYELLFDNVNDKYDYSQLREVNDKLVDATGIPFGLTHAEYKYSDGKFYLIEIQARGGGNFIGTDIVPFISGIDSYNELIKWAVGIESEVEFDYNNLSNKCSILFFFDAPGEGGVVKEIKGVDYLESLGSKIKYHLNFSMGDTIVKAKDDSKRIGWYILFADNRAELNTIIYNINKKFQIVYKNGKDN